MSIESQFSPRASDFETVKKKKDDTTVQTKIDQDKEKVADVAVSLKKMKKLDSVKKDWSQSEIHLLEEDESPTERDFFTQKIKSPEKSSTPDKDRITQLKLKSIEELEAILKEDVFEAAAPLQKLQNNLIKDKHQLLKNEEELAEIEKFIESYRFTYKDLDKMPSGKRMAFDNLESAKKKLILENELLKTNISSTKKAIILIKNSDAYKKSNPPFEFINEKSNKIKILIIKKETEYIDLEINELEKEKEKLEKELSSATEKLKIDFLSSKILSLNNEIDSKIKIKNEKLEKLFEKFEINHPQTFQIVNLKRKLIKIKDQLISNKRLLIDDIRANKKKLIEIENQILKIQTKRKPTAAISERLEKLLIQKEELKEKLIESRMHLELHKEAEDLQNMLSDMERYTEVDKQLSFSLMGSHLTEKAGFLGKASVRRILLLKFGEALNNKKLQKPHSRLFTTLLPSLSPSVVPQSPLPIPPTPTTTPSPISNPAAFGFPLFPINPTTMTLKSSHPTITYQEPASPTATQDIGEKSGAETAVRVGIATYNLNKDSHKEKLEKDILSLKDQREALTIEIGKLREKISKELDVIKKKKDLNGQEFIDFIQSFNLTHIEKSGLSKSELNDLVNFLDNFELSGFESADPSIKKLTEDFIRFVTLSNQLFFNQLSQEMRGAILEEDPSKISEITALLGGGIQTAGRLGSQIAVDETLKTIFHFVNFGGGGFVGLLSIAMGIKDLASDAEVHKMNAIKLKKLDKEIDDLNYQLAQLNKELEIASSEDRPRIAEQITKLEISRDARMARKKKITKDDKFTGDLQISKNALSTAGGFAGITSASLGLSASLKSLGTTVAIGAGALTVGAAATGIGAAVLGGTALIISGIIYGKRYAKNLQFEPVKLQYKKVKRLEKLYNQKVEEMVKSKGEFSDEIYEHFHDDLAKVMSDLKREQVKLDKVYEQFLAKKFEKNIQKASSDILGKISKNVDSLDRESIVDLITEFEPREALIGGKKLELVELDQLREYAKHHHIPGKIDSLNKTALIHAIHRHFAAQKPVGLESLDLFQLRERAREAVIRFTIQ